VNEVLEAAVLRTVNVDFVTPVRQTTWSAEELAAHPESFTRSYDDTLKRGGLPLTLPFSLGLEEARIY